MKPNGKSHLAGVSLRLASPVACFVMHQGRERDNAHFVMEAVAGARRTRGRRKTGGAPPKPPATIPVSVALSNLGLRFALTPRRCGVLSADCCGSGTQCLWRRCGVPVACCCGSGNLATLRRHVESAVAPPDELNRRSRLWEARTWVSSRKLAFMVSAWTCGLFFNRDFRSVSVSLSLRALSWRRLTLVFSAARFSAASLVSGGAVHYAGRYGAHLPAAMR